MRRIGVAAEVSDRIRCSVVTVSLVSALALVLVWSGPAYAAEWESILAALSLPKGAHEEVLNGKLVTQPLSSASDRELAVSMIFLIKTDPERIVDSLLDGIVIEDNAGTHAYGRMTRESVTEDLAKLSMNPHQVQRWLSASPGSDINLSDSEFKIVRGELSAPDGKAVPAKRVAEAAREVLLARTRDYQRSGLKGIQPYSRADGTLRNAAGELRTATRASREIGLFSDGFYDLLLSYPSALPPGFRESYFWSNEQADKSAVLCLTHRFTLPQGAGFAAVQRQFYVTAGYNVEQSLVLLVPVKAGTLVVYTNRTSTDMVAGFGGALKRKIGDDLMGRSLEKLYGDIAEELSAGQ